MTTRIEIAASARSRATFAWFVPLYALFLAGNAIVRWLRSRIFLGHGAYSWTPPSSADKFELVVHSALPFLTFGLLVYALLGGFINTRKRVVALLIASLAGILLLEADMSWYSLAGRHVSSSEVWIFLSEDWQRHLGLRESDGLRFLGLALGHAAVLFVTLVAASWLARRSTLLVFSRRSALIAAIALLVLDTQSIGLRIAHATDPRQWAALALQHPLRLSRFDNLQLHLGARAKFIERINERYARIEPATQVQPNPLLQAASPLTIGAGQMNVVVLAMEGINVRFLDQLTALDALRANGIVVNQHYSTGDATHYGLLGISHGLPMTMYGGTQRPQSQYIDVLNAAGYRTRRFGADFTVFGQIGEYVRNFNEPTFEAPDDDSILSELKGYLADTSSPKFALVYYFRTHWPYQHSAAYRRFQPEVGADFNYASWDVLAHKNEVINRYRNALDELNAWLTNFLDIIDLSRTILVITADHGEEMFEQGRITHAGGTWEGQIRTPLVIHIPNAPPAKIDSINSHAHILPAIISWLRLGDRMPQDPFATSCTIAAHNNHTSRPKELACITTRYKIRFELEHDTKFVITAITDRLDEATDLSIAESDEELTSGLRMLKAAEIATRRHFQ